MLISPQQEALIGYLEHIGVVEPQQRQLPPFKGNLIKAGRSLLKAHDTFHVQAEIFISKEHGLLMTEGYKAVLVRLPALAHAIYQGIDTASLDERMSRVNWAESHHGIYAMSEEAQTAYREILQLSKLDNEDARIMADMLMLRHWVMTPLEHHLTGAADRDLYRREMFFPLQRPDLDIEILPAYNLMCDRAIVHRQGINPDGSVKIGWATLDGNGITEWPDFDIAGILKRIPFEPALQGSTEKGKEFLRQIVTGTRAEASIRYRGKTLKVGIEADPRNSTLAIFDEAGKRLNLSAVNQKYDPLKKRNNERRKGPGL